PRRRGRPARECWGTSTARTARSLPPWTGKRVPLVSRAPKIVLPRRLNKHGTRQDEVRQPAQLPRRAHRAAATRVGAGGADAVPDSRARDARPARRGREPRGPPADADPRRGVPEVAHPRRSEEHTSELQSRGHLVCRLLLEKKK